MTELQPVVIFFPIGDEGEEGMFAMDATLSEVTELVCQVTKYAVEQGAEETDHIEEPEEDLSLTGSVVGAGSLIFGPSGRSKLISAKDTIRAMAGLRRPLTIISGMDVYYDMGMSRVRISRDSPLEKVEVAMDFTKLRFAIARETDVPQELVKGDNKGQGAKGKAGETKASGGKAQPETATPAPKEQSLLRKMTKGGASVSSIIGG